MACSTSSMPMPSSTISISCEVLFTYMLMHCTANVSPHRTSCRQRTIIMSMSELFIIVSFVKLTTNRLMCGSAISTSSGLTATQKSFAHHAERANEKHRAVSTEVNVHGVRSHSTFSEGITFSPLTNIPLMFIIIFASEMMQLRMWRNRHTRTFEGRVRFRVRVQVPSSALKRKPCKSCIYRAFLLPIIGR